MPATNENALVQASTNQNALVQFSTNQNDLVQSSTNQKRRKTTAPKVMLAGAAYALPNIFLKC